MATGYLSKSEKQKRYRHKNRDNGKCPRCSKNVVEGKKMCQYHLDYHYAAYKKWKSSLITREVTK